MRFARAGALAATLFLVGAVFAVPRASAFGLTGIGGKLGYVDPESSDGALTLGAHMEFEQRGSRVHLLPSLMWWDTDGVTDLNPNMDVYYHFNPEGRTTPYLGAGMGLHSYDFEGTRDGDTDLGMNLFGGLRIPSDRMHFFLEGRYVVSDLNQVSVLGGATFHWMD